MPMSEEEVRRRFRELKNLHEHESERLTKIHEYMTDTPERRVRFLPSDVPDEVRELAKIGRVNMLPRIVRGAYQMMYVDGYRVPRGDTNLDAWQAWQANQMDSRQIGVHRAALTYGVSYVTVLPGKQETGGFPVMRGHSPRRMTCAWGDDDLWPEFALEKVRAGWRLYDNEAVYPIRDDRDDVESVAIGEPQSHGAGVTPVVRYRDSDDLDEPSKGIAEPLIPLQDQINVTTFGLLVAQHYGAFRQRYIVGWLGESETERLKMGAARLMTFEDGKQDIEVGEFGQTNLDGYISSRDSTLRQLIVKSQSSAHELLGQLVNLSADALAAAEASAQRASGEHRIVMGEAHEQMLGLTTKLMGAQAQPMAEVRWQDTEIRTLAQVADALGKFAQMLGIPTRALWDRAADALGASQTEVQRWESLVTDSDSFQKLLDELDRQAANANTNPNGNPAPAGGGAR